MPPAAPGKELVPPRFDMYRSCMLPFQKTGLWRQSFGSQIEDDENEARAVLCDRLLDIRQRAELLVSLIRRDLPAITVHDISHLDTLWETASLIAGDNYPINPAEAFVFGAAVLLHDAAMCVAAYPEGMLAIRRTPQCADAIASLLQDETGKSPTPVELLNPPDEILRAALPDVLRELHAAEAEKLPVQNWPGPNGAREQLIQDSGIRNAYGNIIGKIAASHWWPVAELRHRLPPRVNAGPGVPSQWFVQPIKLACLLRVADAAQIDHRRAPHFLRALLRPKGVSDRHWAFQSKLGKPSIDKNFIVFTGGPFALEDAEAWWLCYEMLGVVDEELRSVQAVLDAYNLPAFAVSGVKGAKSPESVAELVTTEGWRPINTELRVSDVPALVALLGGERLYGSNTAVPLRELIQNAADAIRAKRLVVGDTGGSGTIRVCLRDDDARCWLEVEDDGIGMSTAVLTGALLDFGRSFWRSAALRREFPGLLAKGLQPTGRYGIGFFSVFMLGDRVTVTSRRYDAAGSDTHTLDFHGGLRVRPILRQPKPHEALSQPGTRVSVELRIAPDEPGGLLYRGTNGGKKVVASLRDLAARICPALDVTVEVQQHSEHRERAVSANDWLHEQSDTLFRRASYTLEVGPNRVHLYAAIRELRDELDGKLHGRACIYPTSFPFSTFGVVTVGGLRAAAVSGIGGLLVGESQTVSRDIAMPTVTASALQRWATEQGGLLASSSLSAREKLRAAALVMGLGGEVGDLPIAVRDWEYLNSSELVQILSDLETVNVFHGEEIHFEDDDDVRRRDFENSFEISCSLFLVPNEELSLLTIGEEHWPGCVPNLHGNNRPRTCDEAFVSALERAWGVSPDEDEDMLSVGKVGGTKIQRTVLIYRRPDATE